MLKWLFVAVTGAFFVMAESQFAAAAPVQNGAALNTVMSEKFPAVERVQYYYYDGPRYYHRPHYRYYRPYYDRPYYYRPYYYHDYRPYRYYRRYGWGYPHYRYYGPYYYYPRPYYRPYYYHHYHHYGHYYW